MTTDTTGQPEVQFEDGLPSDPTLRKALKDGVQEIVNSMVRVQGEQDFQREAIKELAKKLKVKGNKIRQFARWALKGNAKEQAINISNAEAEFQILFNEGQANP